MDGPSNYCVTHYTLSHALEEENPYSKEPSNTLPPSVRNHEKVCLAKKCFQPIEYALAVPTNCCGRKVLRENPRDPKADAA